MIGLVIAYIFHWWLGLILLLSGALIAVALTVGYVKTVTTKRYPDGDHNPEEI
jgi:ABC-type protease/lipase transport system fused ATPase/permease subunit